MKILLLLEGVVEVLPLLLLCLNVVCILGCLFAFLAVVVLWALWLAVSSLASEKIESLKRTLWNSQLGELYRKVCYTNKRLYQEFEPFQVFVINFCFKASCISIICTILEDELSLQALFVGVGGMVTFNVAHHSYEGRSNNERIVSAIYYAVTNVVFPSRCPMITGSKSFPQVICVNMLWVLIYTVTVIALMYNKGIPTLNIAFWSFDDVHYVNIIHKCIVLLLGPLSMYVMFKMSMRSPDEVDFDAMNDFDKFRYVCLIEDRRDIS